ncbi:SDR family NAD(P)-dependent oxidoreductase [Caballeronia zhejiangensis]|uniref:SDR family NAD(P)-dependent oxidoreductase n=1 Tax=Caballeronia zhejiangensis TaxID=871203 RepID=UPI001EF40400|nr:SDR family oxidoreductase [Caballeronia zhejiangensis]MCG7400344.1 SDR family oxidoreductase [Caballeronia zhejiangensis]
MKHADHAPRIDSMTHSPIEELTALVVGGGSGMGEASAQAFAANGGSVVVADLDGDRAQRVATGIASHGGEAIAVRLDVSNQEHIDAAVKRTVARYGKLDVLINTSALVTPARLEDVSLDTWQRCFRVNVDGALMLARTCLPHLRRSAFASIVNVGSLAGEHGYAKGGAYGPSKAALLTLSRQMALEWAAYGVRVNVVNPGTIDTPMSRGAVRREVLSERAKTIPMGRLGEPGEVADLIAFLASPAASYITAQAFNCDGGLSQSMFSQPMGVPQPQDPIS